MPVELRVPSAGESISEVRIGAWRKAEGDYVRMDEVVVELETDKAAMELPAPASGTLGRILAPEGADASVGDVIGLIEEGGEPPLQPADTGTEPSPRDEARPDAQRSPDEPRVMPSARRVLQEAAIPASRVEGTGPGGRVLKEDGLRAARAEAKRPSAPADPPPAVPETRPAPEPAKAVADSGPRPSRDAEAVPMTPIRRAIARNLVAAQQNAALLTTFNEIDMSAVIALRQRYRDSFKRRHGVKLGFMSFFVKAAVDALRAFPAINARIDGTDIIYRAYQDIGIAVGGGRALVVPVLRNAEAMSFPAIERAVADFAARARENRIQLSELMGGTFTISNGGIYGSMLSTPIVNSPQSGILGMHAIQDRPVAVDGEVEVRPMMYVALTYDHRIVDGREAVGFLKRVKDLVERPERIWLEV